MRKCKAAKRISILLVLVILMSMTVMAAPQRASSYLSSYMGSLAVKENGDLSIYFRVTAPRLLDQLGVSTIYIQRDVGYWTTEIHLTYPEYEQLQGTDVGYYTTIFDYTPEHPGDTYRALFVFYGKDSDGSDTGRYLTDGVS